jgi:hypothetical protein
MKIGTTNNIKDLAPTLAEKYTEEEMDENIHGKYNKRIECYKNIMGSRSKYFFGSLHDAKIFSLKVKSGNLHLTLNDCATHQFSRALIEKMKLNDTCTPFSLPAVPGEPGALLLKPLCGFSLGVFAEHKLQGESMGRCGGGALLRLKAEGTHMGSAPS